MGVNHVTAMLQKGYAASPGRLETKADYIHFYNHLESIHKADELTFDGDTVVFPNTAALSYFLFVTQLVGFYAAFDVTCDPQRDTDKTKVTPHGIQIPHLDFVSNIRVSGAEPGSTVHIHCGEWPNHTTVLSGAADEAGNCHFPVRLCPIMCQFLPFTLEVAGSHPRFTFSVIICPSIQYHGHHLRVQEVVQVVRGRLLTHRYAGGMMAVMADEPVVPLVKSLRQRELTGRHIHLPENWSKRLPS